MILAIPSSFYAIHVWHFQQSHLEFVCSYFQHQNVELCRYDDKSNGRDRFAQSLGKSTVINIFQNMYLDIKKINYSQSLTFQSSRRLRFGFRLIFEINSSTWDSRSEETALSIPRFKPLIPDFEFPVENPFNLGLNSLRIFGIVKMVLQFSSPPVNQ